MSSPVTSLIFFLLQLLLLLSCQHLWPTSCHSSSCPPLLLFLIPSPSLSSSPSCFSSSFPSEHVATLLWQLNVNVDSLCCLHLSHWPRNVAFLQSPSCCPTKTIPPLSPLIPSYFLVLLVPFLLCPLFHSFYPPLSNTFASSHGTSVCSSSHCLTLFHSAVISPHSLIHFHLTLLTPIFFHVWLFFLM